MNLVLKFDMTFWAVMRAIAKFPQPFVSPFANEKLENPSSKVKQRLMDKSTTLCFSSIFIRRGSFFSSLWAVCVSRKQVDESAQEQIFSKKPAFNLLSVIYIVIIHSRRVDKFDKLNIERWRGWQRMRGFSKRMQILWMGKLFKIFIREVLKCVRCWTAFDWQPVTFAFGYRDLPRRANLFESIAINQVIPSCTDLINVMPRKRKSLSIRNSKNMPSQSPPLGPSTWLFCSDPSANHNSYLYLHLERK